MTSRFGLYLVLTNPTAGYEACTEAAVLHNVRYVQLRMKDTPREEVLRVGRRLRDLTRGCETQLIVNDDLEVAIAIGADGLHVGQSDISLEVARELWPAERQRVLGLSTHNEAQAHAARERSPDYIGVGPLFPTPTKRIADPVLGLQRAAAIIHSSPLTCVAIGGIDDHNLPAILAMGIHNFAVVRYVCQNPRPAESIALLMTLWRDARDAESRQGSL